MKNRSPVQSPVEFIDHLEKMLRKSAALNEKRSGSEPTNFYAGQLVCGKSILDEIAGFKSGLKDS